MEGGASSSAGANWAQLTGVQLQQQHTDQLTLKVNASTQPPQQQQQHTLQQQQRKWQQQQQKLQQQQLQQQQEAISLFNRWVKAGFRPKLTLDLRPGGMFISLLCRPAAATAKKRPAKRANAKRLEKQRARRASQQREQQATAAAAVSAAAPAAITPSGKLQQPFLAATAAPATVAASATATATAATAVPLTTAATTVPQAAATVPSPARSRAILSLKDVARRETRSASKKRKVETPSDSDPATPEGGSFTLLTQLDGAAQSPTSPAPEPAPPDIKKLPPDGDGWSTVRPPRRNPR